jgi:hypothetical protein
MVRPSLWRHRASDSESALSLPLAGRVNPSSFWHRSGVLWPNLRAGAQCRPDVWGRLSNQRDVHDPMEFVRTDHPVVRFVTWLASFIDTLFDQYINGQIAAGLAIISLYLSYRGGCADDPHLQRSEMTNRIVTIDSHQSLQRSNVRDESTKRTSATSWHCRRRVGH